MRTLFLAPLLGITALLLPTVLLAQNTCADYHKFNCQRSSDKRFSQNGQSKSAALQVGVPTELNIIVYRGQDYRISLCADDRILGEAISIRLVEKVREATDLVEESSTLEPLLDEEGNKTGATQETRTKQSRRVFEEVEKVLWDNADHEMAQEVEFSCAATKRIAIQVVPPGTTRESKRSDKQYDIGCAGILIEHMPTPGLGF